MSNRYDEVPTTGAHRGGRLTIPITGSVRAQEAVDPLRARKKQPAQSAPPSEKGDEKTEAVE